MVSVIVDAIRVAESSTMAGFRYAFIEYKSGSSARKAVSRGNKMTLDGRELLVDMECERELKGTL